jgi:HSP20 family protein
MMSPFPGFAALDRLLDDVMQGVTGTTYGLSSGASFVPLIDVRANDEEIVFSVDVPGVKQEEIDVSLEAGVLTIRGERKYTGDPGDKVWLGRGYGPFRRSFTLPDYVEPDKLSAELADGVLTIRVPRQEQAKPRRIPVGSGSGPKQLNG